MLNPAFLFQHAAPNRNAYSFDRYCPCSCADHLICITLSGLHLCLDDSSSRVAGLPEAKLAEDLGLVVPAGWPANATVCAAERRRCDR
jgi:hypothetical protein